MAENGMRPVHLGETLKEDSLKPAGLSVNALAKGASRACAAPNDIVLESRGHHRRHGDASRAPYFGGDAQSWLNLPMIYDLRVAEHKSARQIEREVVPAEEKPGSLRPRLPR
jgi:plasmid maintenance system antidote protein VapI